MKAGRLRLPARTLSLFQAVQDCLRRELQWGQLRRQTETRARRLNRQIATDGHPVNPPPDAGRQH